MDADAARARILAEHREPFATVLDCADVVADGWGAGDARPATTDRDAVTGALRAALARAGVLERFPAVLRAAVAAGGGTLRGEPVAAPPYVTVASRGPVLRGTVGSGERLVVTCEVFDVERWPTRYVRGAATVEAALSVTVRRRPGSL